MRRPDSAALIVLPLLLAGLGTAVVAQADESSPRQQLHTVEKQLDETREKQTQFAQKAQELATEIASLRAEGIAAARSAQEHETALTQLENQLATLNAEEATKAAELKRHQVQQRDLLMALERLARNPPEALALAPGDPLDTVRSALLMGAAIPPIEARARALKQELADLALLRQQIAEAQSRHRAERLSLDDEQTRLAALIARKAELQQQAQQGEQETGQRQLALAAQATDLHQLIDRLESERKQREAEAQKEREEAARRAAEEANRLRSPAPGLRAPGIELTAPPPTLPDPSKPKVIRSIAKARGALIIPASGRLVLRFGQDNELGVTSKGLTFATRPGAQVIAPYDGRILFAGPFKGYGHILIIEHGDGYHSLLAGLGRLEGTVGEWLVAGEPVGTMPRGDTQPRLYLELRHDGQPINPLPWLATREEKVSG